jgi:hypothetical protein
MNRLIKAIRALLPNCKQAIRLQSDALDRPLSTSQWLGLRLHLAFCKWCVRYGEHIKFLQIAAQCHEHDHRQEQAMPPEARERIKRALKSRKD